MCQPDAHRKIQGLCLSAATDGISPTSTPRPARPSGDLLVARGKGVITCGLFALTVHEDSGNEAAHVGIDQRRCMRVSVEQALRRARSNVELPGIRGARKCVGLEATTRCATVVPFFVCLLLS